MNHVPCNGCQACCKRERIIMSEENGDNPEEFHVVPTKKGNDGAIEWMLAHKPNGDCIYLGETGCTIHGRQPWACRQFDCRAWFLGFPEALQELLLPDDLDGEVVRAAMARIPNNHGK